MNNPTLPSWHMPETPASSYTKHAKANDVTENTHICLHKEDEDAL